MGGVSRLALVPVRRSAVTTFDVVINGVKLVERIHQHEGPCDSVSPLGSDPEAVDRLLLEAPPDLPGGRTSILVCPQCGDLGCGAVSAVLVREAERIRWMAMGVANNLETGEGPWLYQTVTSFEFSWSEYKEAFRGVRLFAR